MSDLINKGVRQTVRLLQKPSGPGYFCLWQLLGHHASDHYTHVMAEVVHLMLQQSQKTKNILWTCNT
jgi:hypothetical protein